MSVNVMPARGGDFATSERCGIAQYTDFILSQKAKGVPPSAIARMIRRAEADVRTIYGLGPEAPEIERPPPAPLRQSRLPPHIRALVEPVAAKHGVGIGDLIAKGQAKKLAAARQEAWATVYATGRYSLPQIGAWFDRDHSSVHRGIGEHNARIAVDEDVAAWKALGKSSVNRPQDEIVCGRPLSSSSPAVAKQSRQEQAA